MTKTLGFPGWGGYVCPVRTLQNFFRYMKSLNPTHGKNAASTAPILPGKPSDLPPRKT